MRLGYFNMPMHPQPRTPTGTLQEDREAMLTWMGAIFVG